MPNIPANLSLASNLVMLFSMMMSPSMDPKYQPAAKAAFTATLEMPGVKEDLNVVSKNGEKIFWKYSPLTEAQLSYAAWTGPIITGQVTTRPIANWKYVTKDGFTIRPDFEYNYRTDQSYNVMITLTKGF